MCNDRIRDSARGQRCARPAQEELGQIEGLIVAILTKGHFGIDGDVADDSSGRDHDTGIIVNGLGAGGLVCPVDTRQRVG